MKFIKKIRKIGLIILALFNVNILFGQNLILDTFQYVDDTTQIIEPANPYKECLFNDVQQSFVLHFVENAKYVVDLNLELPIPVELYERNGDNNVLIGILNDPHQEFILDRFKNYVVKTMNTCGESRTIDEFSTIPLVNSEAIYMPSKLYEAVANSAANDVTIFDYIKTDEILTNDEKLYLVQEYYFDGDLNLALNIISDDENNDLPTGGPPWDDPIVAFADAYNWDFWKDIATNHDGFWPQRENNCKCKVIFEKHLANHYKLAGWVTEDDYTYSDHWNHGTHGYMPMRGGYTKNGGEDNDEEALKKRRWSHHQLQEGAFKHMWLDQDIDKKIDPDKRKTEKKSYPDEAKFASDNDWETSTYRTQISLMMKCENNQNQNTNTCLCEDRIVEINSSYETNIKAKARATKDKFQSSAKAEDWAMLLVKSTQTDMKLLASGRSAVNAYHNSTQDDQYMHSWASMAVTLAKIVASYYTNPSQTIDPSDPEVQRIIDDLAYILNNKRYKVEQLNAAATSELLDGYGTSGHAIKLLPNDETDIAIYSFAALKVEGKGKWEAAAEIKSDGYIVCHLEHQETEECCNEEVFEWVEGNFDESNWKFNLKNINSFLHPRVSWQGQYYSTAGGQYRYTGFHSTSDKFSVRTNAYIHNQSNRCLPSNKGTSRIVDPADHYSIAPIGTTVVISTLINHSVVYSGQLSQPTTLGDLKNLVLNNSSLQTGVYVIYLSLNGQTQVVKFVKS